MFNKINNVLKKAVKFPKYGAQLLLDKYEATKYKKQNLQMKWIKLSFQDHVLQEMKFTKPSSVALTQLDRELVNDIRFSTSKLNRNNITRTQAYLDFYKKHPEIHWALLAHLVSRNGGWNMTDLKGSILTDILPTDSKNDFFDFLERSNALIFHDAYPQLLLYEASKQQRKNLFYLLPKLRVSSFMRPFWDNFLESHDTKLLTVALIVNEQNYIERRVVQHALFKENVLENILFKMQEYLQWTYVLFPYSVKGKKHRLAGLTVTDFTNVHHRVEIGKKLYCLLFGIENLHQDIYKFVTAVPHSASRSDYWSKMFTKFEQEILPIVSISCKPSKPIVFSPTLEQAWPDKKHSFSDTHDWFNPNDSFLHYFKEIDIPATFDITFDYCQDLNQMVAASSLINIVQS